MFDTTPITRHFLQLLNRVRQVERFALGRRILAMTALGSVRDRVEDDGLWHQTRRHAHGQLAAELRIDVASLAVMVERRRPELNGVFTQALASDVLQSANVPEIVQLAAVFVREFDLFPLEVFGDWLSERLDDTPTFGPVISELATSARLSDLLVRLAAVSPGGTVYDPCCGMGNLLVAAKRLAGPDLELCGTEVHPTSWAFAKLRMYLMDANAQVQLGDGLRSPFLRAGGFDHVICEPPSGGPAFRAADTAARLEFAQRNVRLESAFIVHCAEALAPKGRAAILVPQSVLTRKGHEERLRQSLAYTGQLQAIVSLPASVGAWASADLAVLILRSRSLEEHDVRMIDGQRALGDERRGSLTWEEIELLTALVEGRVDQSAAVDVSAAELLRADRFRPASYFTRQTERVDIDALLADAERHDGIAQEQARRIRELSARLGRDGAI